MDKNFKGRKEFEKILIELDRWNEKYNKSKDKYLTMACVEGSWQVSNDYGRWGHIDFYIGKEEMAEMREVADKQMTKIEELEQKLNEASSGFEFVINEIRKELVCYKTQKELKESKKEGKWKPTVGEEYWFKNDIGKVSHSTYMCSVDECRANSVPLFKTEEECERYWRFMDTVKEKSYEFSELDWQDDGIKKWVIEYNYLTDQLRVSDHRYIKRFGLVYFKDKESAQYIIDNFKDELMEYFV